MTDNSNKGTRMIGPVPLVLAIILLIWLVLGIIHWTIGVPHSISLPIVVATIIWWVVWFIRLAIRDND